LLPVVLPFIEFPVVVELAAWPPEAELPPADAPEPEPALCAEATPERASIAITVIEVSFMPCPFWFKSQRATCAWSACSYASSKHRDIRSSIPLRICELFPQLRARGLMRPAAVCAAPGLLLLKRRH
jgi:hypothetical protein